MERSVRRLTYQVDGLQAQLVRVVTVLAVAPIIVLVVLSVFADAFEEVDENGQVTEDGARFSLRGLVSVAGDAESSLVQALAALTLVALLVVLALAVTSAASDRGWVPVVAMIAAGLLAVSWLMLMGTVASSGGGGYVDDLGVEATAPAWWPGITAVVTLAGLGLLRSARKDL